MSKILRFSMVLVLTMISVFSFAQTDEISDEELTRYAEMMDSVDVMKKNIEETIKEMVASTEEITGARYNDLYKHSKNPDKLAELEATEPEISFLVSLDSVKDAMTKDLKKTYGTMAKEYVGDGGRTFNKISRALKSDEEVKARYSAIQEGLKPEEQTEETN